MSQPWQAQLVWVEACSENHLPQRRVCDAVKTLTSVHDTPSLFRHLPGISGETAVLLQHLLFIYLLAICHPSGCYCGVRRCRRRRRQRL